MKKLFIGLVAAALFAVNGTRAQNHPIEILPKPVKIVAFQNAAVLSGETSVYLDPKAIRFIRPKPRKPNWRLNSMPCRRITTTRRIAWP